MALKWLTFRYPKNTWKNKEAESTWQSIVVENTSESQDDTEKKVEAFFSLIKLIYNRAFKWP